MARHRDFRNMDLDDYADDDDNYDVGSYGANDVSHSPGSQSYVYNRNAPVDPVAYHREQLHQANRKHQQQEPPKQVEHSAAFFKTKPAKKGKPTGGASTVAAPIAAAKPATATRPPPGSAPATPAAAPLEDDRMTMGNGGSDELFGGDEFDEETAVAIAASLAESKHVEEFHREAGVLNTPAKNPSATSAPSSASSTPARAFAPSSSPQPLRSEHAARETERALEQLRLEKQKAAGGPSATSTPGRRGTEKSPQRSPQASPSRGTASAAAAASTSGDSLAVPGMGRGMSQSKSANQLSRQSSEGSSGPPSPRTPNPGGAAASSSSSDRLEVGAAAPPTVSAKRAKDVTAAEEQEAGLNESGQPQKARLNMVVIGHVDAGKSTLMGHLLFLQGRVSKKIMHKYEKESREMGKSSFHFAWVLDETDEERTRGVTTDVAVNYFETPSKKITLLDAPGHKEFIPNMITGAAQADAAILVVPATKGEFEGGFGEDGQIREHAVLARSLGVSQLIVAVNKLDTTGWSSSRYNEIVSQMLPYLKSVGYKDRDLFPVPVSGLTGENIMECKEPALKEWYDGPVLLDLIDRFSLPQRHTDRPLRLCVQDVFKTLTLGQVLAGKIETGTVLVKDKLLLLPLGETLQVRAMESRGENLIVGRAGDNIEIGVKDFSDAQVLQIGQWLCDPQYPIPMVTHFQAQIITMNYRIPLITGAQLTFFTQANTEPVSILKITAIIDKVTGAVVKKMPRVLPRETTALVEFTSKNKICMELFRNFKALGRFSLRRGGETVAVGITTKLFQLR